MHEKWWAAIKQSKGPNQRKCFSSALTALWPLFWIYTPGSKMRSAWALCEDMLKAPSSGLGDAAPLAPQGLGFHSSAALERQLLHLVGTASSWLGSWACSFILQSRQWCPGQPRLMVGLPQHHRHLLGCTRSPDLMQQGWPREMYLLIKDTWKRGAERQQLMSVLIQYKEEIKADVPENSDSAAENPGVEGLYPRVFEEQGQHITSTTTAASLVSLTDWASSFSDQIPGGRENHYGHVSLKKPGAELRPASFKHMTLQSFKRRFHRAWVGLVSQHRAGTGGLLTQLLLVFTCVCRQILCWLFEQSKYLEKKQWAKIKVGGPAFTTASVQQNKPVVKQRCGLAEQSEVWLTA